MPCHVQTLLCTALHGTARKSDRASGRRFRSVSRFATRRISRKFRTVRGFARGARRAGAALGRQAARTARVR
ncbi:hypothetical protein EHZ18_30475 [Burkholderia vietnamiensis]|nr:hypothetical protein EHZ18_30475 [Burkholderia vietnamiensis]